MGYPATAPEVRFWRFVTRGEPDECWIWQGVTGGSNERYGYFNPTANRRGKKIPAHRFAYEMLVGPIPDGLELDHLCRRPLCVNPSHLEPVTHAENRRRARLAVCRSGRHDLTLPENQRWDRNGDRRGCKACWRAAATLRQQQRRHQLESL